MKNLQKSLDFTQKILKLGRFSPSDNESIVICTVVSSADQQEKQNDDGTILYFLLVFIFSPFDSSTVLLTLFMML